MKHQSGTVIVKSVKVRKFELMPLVKRICSQKYASAPTHVEYQDVVGAAFLGLSDANKRFRKAKANGGRFSTLAYARIMGSVKDFIRREHCYASRYTIDSEDVDLRLAKCFQESSFANRNLFESVCKIISGLPYEHMRALVGVYMEGLSDLELARELHTTKVLAIEIKVAALETVRMRFLALNPVKVKRWIE